METRLDHRRYACSNFINKVRSRPGQHPHQDAIHVAGWVSLFTLHVLWPFLWIWATVYRPDRGWGFNQRLQQDEDEIQLLKQELADLKARIDTIQQTEQQG